MKSTADTFTELCCAALRGEAPAWPLDSGADTVAASLQHLGYHGVGPLIWEAMQATPQWSSWPPALCLASGREYRALTALEMLRQRELQGVLAELHDRHIDALLLKGTALAYGLYPRPVLRPRTDTDILIEPHNQAVVRRLLRELGYRTPTAITGTYVSTQSLFLKREPAGLHAIDLHWRISNAQVFARHFDFAALAAESRPIEKLGEVARALSLIDALLHACLHRAVHIPRGEHDRVLWYYDIHLLASRLDEPQWASLTEKAGAKGMRAICADALQHCQRILHTPVPARVMAELTATDGPAEISAALLHGSGIKTAWVNYRALSSWRARAALLREQVLPTPDYMRARYGVDGCLPLTRAYVVRLIRGPAKLVGRRRR